MSKHTYKTGMNVRRLSLVPVLVKGEEAFFVKGKWGGYKKNSNGYLCDEDDNAIILFNRLSNRKVQKTDDEDKQRNTKKGKNAAKPNGKGKPRMKNKR